MPQFHWRLPMHGDKADVAKSTLTRGTWGPLLPGNQAPGLAEDGGADGVPYHDYLLETARAIEIAGFDGALIPSFPDTDDPWVAATSIARHTKTFRFMIAFQPEWMNPLYAAKAAASIQRLSGGRLLFNIITGGGGPDQLWWGDAIAHDDRYQRTAEFLDIFKGVWDGGPFTYRGKFFQVENAGLPAPLAGQVFPELYFVGSSDAALAAQAKHAHYYLTHLEPFDQLRAKFQSVKTLALKHGRPVKLAARFDVLARETEEEAWAEARRGWEAVDWDAREQAFARARGGDSVGSRRQLPFAPVRGKSLEDLVIAPNLWAGFGPLRPGPTLGVVGSYAQVAAKIDELIEMGVEGFILSATPALEEALRVGEEVLPLVRGRLDAGRLAAE